MGIDVGRATCYHERVQPAPQHGWEIIAGSDRRRPGVELVRQRALCLGAVGAYGELEDAYCAENVPTLNELTRFALEEVSEWLTDWERSVFGRQEWTEDASYQAVIANEPFGVLLWALGCVEELPPFDVMVHGLEAYEWLGSLQRGEHKLRLRQAPALRKALSAAEFWVARAEISPIDDLDAVSDLLATQPPEMRASISLDDGDLLVCGDLGLQPRPYHKLEQEDLETARTFAQQRLHTLKWLCGELGNWADCLIS